MQADRMENARDMRAGNNSDVKKRKAKTTDGDKVKVKAD